MPWPLGPTKRYIDALRAVTVCAHCGAQPIDWHNPDHIHRPTERIGTMRTRNRRLDLVKAEIARCTPLCRRCHMAEDGRLKALIAVGATVHARKLASPGKPCSVCGRVTKPLRKTLCSRCYDRRRYHDPASDRKQQVLDGLKRRYHAG